MTFTGVVLCGGRSRRMGTDKALLPIDGVPMARRVADALHAAGAAEVLAVGGDPAALRSSGLPVVPDEVPDGGPLPATASALRAAAHPLVLVTACDLLQPSHRAMADVVAHLAAAPAGVQAAVPVVDGHPQWTHAAWRATAVSTLDELLALGVSSLRRAAEHLSLVELTDVDPAAVRDADTPAALPGGSGSPGSLSPMDIPEIDVAGLARACQDGAPVIDVREADEFASARVPGALHIPLGEVPERVGEVPRGGTVYVVCARGGRSAKAVEHYRAQGIDAVNVAGGTIGWIDAGLPVEPGAGSGAGPG